MKYIKMILIAVICIVLPLAILKLSIEYNDLADLANMVWHLYPICLPVFCGWFGIKLFKETGKILLPTTLFNIFLIFSTIYLSEIIIDSIERSLADVAIVLLLYGPMICSVPISPVAAAIYKRKNKKIEEITTDE